MILLRHGQSEFNLHFTATRRDPGIVDARLTEYGHQQAEDAARRLAREKITRIIASPYTRALQTAEPLARVLGLRVRVQPVVRERYGFACDIGTPRARLTEIWPHCDFDAFEDVWWPDAYEPVASVTHRARTFREAMTDDADRAQTVVVTHWGFILCATGQSVQNGETIHCDPTGPLPAQSIWR